MKHFVFTFLLLFLSNCISPNEKNDLTLELHLKGKEYTSLTLYGIHSSEYTTKSNLPFSFIKFNGKLVNGNWLFTIPDSLHQQFEGYLIRTAPFDFTKNEDHTLVFSTKESPNPKRGDIFRLYEKETVLEGIYWKTTSDQVEALVVEDTFAINPTRNYDVFDIKLKKTYTDFDLQLCYPHFGALSSSNYQEDLRMCIDIVKQYPNSKYLIQSLSQYGSNIKKKDLEFIFGNFSQPIKESQSGQEIKKYYLTEKNIMPVAFDTLLLLNAKSNNYERVIAKGSKYTMIVFSASWCGPCHKQIPLLKEIYKDLGKDLNIIYISGDEGDGITRWKELMEKEMIPWTSFLAGDKKEGLYQQYSVRGIPHSILFYPEGKYEEIDVRIKGDREKLYNLITKIQDEI